MTKPAANNLIREKTQQLLTAAGSMPAEDISQIDTAEYNWQEPRYFTGAQLEMLENFTRNVAKAISRVFADLYHSDFSVTVVSTTQHFADEILDKASDAKQGNYFQAFETSKNRSAGFIDIPFQSAIAWTGQLLGETKPQEDSKKDLSQLEESLLLDLPDKKIIKGQVPLNFPENPELCRITFNISENNSETPDEAREVYFVMLCEELRSAVDKNTRTDKEFSAEDISKAILGHLQKIEVTVTAQLASATLTFEEIMSLDGDDILLLDKKADEPIDVVVDYRPIFRGRPAKSAGKYAVVITELCDTG